MSVPSLALTGALILGGVATASGAEHGWEARGVSQMAQVPDTATTPAWVELGLQRRPLPFAVRLPELPRLPLRFRGILSRVPSLPNSLRVPGDLFSPVPFPGPGLSDLRPEVFAVRSPVAPGSSSGASGRSPGRRPGRGGGGGRRSISRGRITRSPLPLSVGVRRPGCPSQGAR